MRRRRTLELQYEGHPSYPTAITLDGRPFVRGYVSRIRDGGTVKFNLTLDGEKHLLVLHRSVRLRNAGREYESFDGEPLERLRP